MVSTRAGGGAWRANMDNAKFKGTLLNGANLRNCDFTKCDFSEADLRNADFRGSLLTDAVFTDADMRGTNFDNTDKRGAIGIPKDDDEDDDWTPDIPAP